MAKEMKSVEELQLEIDALKEQIKILTSAVKRCGKVCMWGPFQIARVEKEKKENG
jgi:AhpD family alkylhydroperoxidase